MLPYRIIRWTTEVYPVAALFFYIGLFLLTFSVCFLMPPAAILLLLFSKLRQFLAGTGMTGQFSKSF